MELSCDGGETRREAPVRHGSAEMTNPTAAGSVSFRAEVSDKQSDATALTLIDAYRTR